MLDVEMRLLGEAILVRGEKQSRDIDIPLSASQLALLVLSTLTHTDDNKINGRE
jgi:hypothetical protein